MVNSHPYPMNDLHCVYCGQTLPPDAAFCSRCGEKLPLGSTPEASSETRALPYATPPPPMPMETCEIGWSRRAQGFTARITFHAETTTMGDKRIIANSEPLPDDRDRIDGKVFIPRPTPQAMYAVNQIVDRLIQEGWQHTYVRGLYWWNYTFFRPLRY